MPDPRTARKQKGLTQRKAASYLGVSQAYLSMLESKRRPVPARQLSRVIEVYGLPPSALPLCGSENWQQFDEAELPTSWQLSDILGSHTCVSGARTGIRQSFFWLL